MRILIILPAQPTATGNHVTAARYATGLRQSGHVVRIQEVTFHDVAALRSVLEEFQPDLTHLLHAWRSGWPWLQATVGTARPYLVTLTGTDLNHDLDSAERGPTCRQIFEQARAIIIQNPVTLRYLHSRFPRWREKIRYLPQGVTLGQNPYSLRQLHGIDEDAILFLHPAGIRPVKGNLELLFLFDAVAKQRKNVVLAFCGPELDNAYVKLFIKELVGRPWARYLGTVAPDAMAAAMQHADVILNNSLSEGLPNALVEAIVVGVPILARAIQGNASIVVHGENGLLFHDADQFCTHALNLIDTPELRRRLGRPRPELYRPQAEAEELNRIVEETMLAGVSRERS